MILGKVINFSMYENREVKKKKSPMHHKFNFHTGFREKTHPKKCDESIRLSSHKY